VKGVNRNLLIFKPIARDLAALAKEDKPVRAVPSLDDVQTFVDFAPKWLGGEIAAQEQRLGRPAELRQGFVGRVLDVAPREPPQNRLRVGGALGHSSAPSDCNASIGTPDLTAMRAAATSSAPCADARLPLVGKVLMNRSSSARSMIVERPTLRAVRLLARTASKILVRGCR